VLALVREVDHRGRLSVVTRHGDALTISAAKVQSAPGYAVPLPPGDEATSARIRELGLAVDEAVAGIDLETIWQLVTSEDAVPTTAEELAQLWFDDGGPVPGLAMLRALRDDAVYFKRKGGRYAPRSPREVEAVRQQLLGARRRSESLEAFVAAVVTACRGDGAEATAGLREDLVLRPSLEVLLDFAAAGELFERREEALKLLEAVAQEPQAPSFRATPLGAFQLLLRLGLVEEHENLALRRYRIRTAFAPELLAEAEALARRLGPEVLEGLVARPELEAFTIDDARTRDIDDALDVRLHADGGCELGIHITDVAALVRPGSALDVEAQKRGSSVYLPTGVIPMFPPVLSEIALSLVAGEPRPVLSFRLRFDGAEQLVARRLEMAVITVRERLTYDDADAQLETGSGRWAAALARLETVALARAEERRAGGAFDIDLPDVQVKVVAGEPVVKRVERTRSRALVGELMVLAGETAAGYCLEEGIPTVFRTQDTVVEEEDRVRAESIAHPLARDFERARLLRRGELRSEPARHRGLGLYAYVQATSPIRRYADLVAHYQLREHLLGRPPVFDSAEMVALAARAEAAASDCVATQRDTDRYWILEHLRRLGGPTVEAVVLSHDPSSGRATVPVVLPDFMLRTNLAAKRLEVGETVAARVVQAEPRRDLLKVVPADE
jgi:exoribonuclease II